MKMNKKGFTLIELLIVVAIIAILAAIAIPQFGAYRARAVRASMVADSKNIATSIETLFQDCNNYLPVDTWNFTGAGTSDILKSAANCTAAPNASFPVNVSKGNTVDIASTLATYTLQVTNTGGDDTSYKGPVIRNNTGYCQWTSNQGC